MKENIKAYYDYLINNNSKFANFVKEIEELSIEELSNKYNIDISLWKT